MAKINIASPAYVFKPPISRTEVGLNAPDWADLRGIIIAGTKNVKIIQNVIPNTSKIVLYEIKLIGLKDKQTFGT